MLHFVWFKNEILFGGEYFALLAVTKIVGVFYQACVTFLKKYLLAKLSIYKRNYKYGNRFVLLLAIAVLNHEVCLNVRTDVICYWFL